MFCFEWKRKLFFTGIDGVQESKLWKYLHLQFRKVTPTSSDGERVNLVFIAPDRICLSHRVNLCLTTIASCIMAKFRLFSLFTLVLYCCAGLPTQYLENFTGQNGKGLVFAILRRRAVSYLFQFCAFIFISALPQKGLSQIVIGGWDVSTLPGGGEQLRPQPLCCDRNCCQCHRGRFDARCRYFNVRHSCCKRLGRHELGYII